MSDLREVKLILETLLGAVEAAEEQEPSAAEPFSWLVVANFDGKTFSRTGKVTVTQDSSPELLNAVWDEMKFMLQNGMNNLNADIEKSIKQHGVADDTIVG